MLIMSLLYVKNNYKHLNTLIINVLIKLIKHNKFIYFLIFFLSN